MEWVCGEKHVQGVGDPACPRRSEDELEDPRACAELWSPLAQSGAQWGCWHSAERRAHCPLHSLSAWSVHARICGHVFCPVLSPELFSSSNQCRGFVQ